MGFLKVSLDKTRKYQCVNYLNGGLKLKFLKKLIL